MFKEKLGVVGATGAAGTVLMSLLAERGYEGVEPFASSRSAGQRIKYGSRELVVKEATAENLKESKLQTCFFAIGSTASRELIPDLVETGTVCLDKSDAFRLEDGVPLIVPEVNGARALEHKGLIAVPNCCTIPLTCVLKPLHDAAGITRLRVATYQSVSGAGIEAMDRLRNEASDEHDLRMDWDFNGEEFDEEEKLRQETQKIMELGNLPVSATCVRVPIMIGHAEAVWIETHETLSPKQAVSLLGAAPSIRLMEVPTPGQAAGKDEVLVGRIRQDRAIDNGKGLSLFIACDNLRKGAALNAVQTLEFLKQNNAI